MRFQPADKFYILKYAVVKVCARIQARRRVMLFGSAAPPGFISMHRVTILLNCGPRPAAA
jgi:hypothetical protein